MLIFNAPPPTGCLVLQHRRATNWMPPKIGTLIFVMTFWSFGALPHTSVHVSFPELGTLNFGVPLKFEMGA